MSEREFNLCHEPWICVMDENCSMRKVTLVEALIHAESYRGLGGETASQNMAILRFLLAVLQTVFTRVDEDGTVSPIDSAKEAIRRWKAIWDYGAFPEKPLREYLNKWEDRFWLFDEEFPFYQVPKIEGTNNPAKKMNGALVESSNKIQLFSIRSGHNKETLNYDEAARWIIYLQSFDDTAAKKPSPKMCHVGGLGAIAAKGNSLFETLMLNLTLLKDGTEIWGEAKPSWERDKYSAEKLQEIPVPDNLPELFTIQCRRVHLHRENGVVSEYTEAAGEYINEESAFVEQMTLWEIRKKDKDVGLYYPKPHDKTKQVWREFSTILGNSSRKPGLVSWITMLQSKNMFPKGRFVGFDIEGVIYGSMCCGIVDEFSDALDMHISLLDELGMVWQKHIISEIERCDKLAGAVGLLGANLNKAIGGTGQEAERTSKSQAYYRLDIPFRQWLAQVNPEQDLEKQTEYRMAWREESLRIVRLLGQEMVEQAGDAAIVGRYIKEKDKDTRHYSAPEAYNYFQYQIKTIDS